MNSDQDQVPPHARTSLNVPRVALSARAVLGRSRATSLAIRRANRVLARTQPAGSAADNPPHDQRLTPPPSRHAASPAHCRCDPRGRRAILERSGPGGLTTNHVAELAGVSIGSLYQYFPNKEALVGALQDRYAEDTLSRVRAVIDDAPLDVLIVRIANAVLQAKQAQRPIHRWLIEWRSAVGGQETLSCAARPARRGDRGAPRASLPAGAGDRRVRDRPCRRGHHRSGDVARDRGGAGGRARDRAAWSRRISPPVDDEVDEHTDDRHDRGRAVPYAVRSRSS